MTYPVVPDVPVGSITVSNVVAGHTNTTQYIEPNSDGSLTAKLEAGGPVNSDNTINAKPAPLITKMVLVKAQAITAGSAVSVYTPTSGKKFNIVAYHLGVSAAAAVIFEDGSGGSSAEILRTGSMAAGAGAVVEPWSLGAGVSSGTADNHLYLDVTGTATVNGWIGLSEL